MKHFKFAPHGKRRIHAGPDAGEITARQCWLDLGRAQVRPALTVLMGASAAQARLGRGVTIGRERGRLIERGPVIEREGGAVMVTMHPSYLLRLSNEAARQHEYGQFVVDLQQARAFTRDRGSAAPR